MSGQSAIKSLPHYVAVFSFLFLIISTSLRSWSNSEATRDSVSGDVTIGLFSACADMPCRNADVDGDRCVVPAVFSTIGECREGHCIDRIELVPTTNWDAENLCDRAASAAAFSILAIFFCFALLMVTSWRALANRPVNWVYGAWFSFFSAFSATIAWCIWARWQTLMNDQPASRRTTDSTTQFDELSVGPGLSMSIVASLMLYANVFFCRFQWTCFAPEDRDSMNSNYALATPDGEANQQSGADPSYLQVGQEQDGKKESGEAPPPRRGSLSSPNQQTPL